MIALAIDFLAGRFHATPWDRSVNEGDVEWPPSPWRLLRALIAAFYLRGEQDVDTLSHICDRMATAPRFILPPATVGHTRHYMPQDKAGVTALVLDAFVAFNNRSARAFVIWDDAVLSTDERLLLERLVSSVTYLGRSESWCQVTVHTGTFQSDGMFEVMLASYAAIGGRGIVARRLGVDGNFRGLGLLGCLSEDTNAMRKRKAVLPNGSVWLDYRFPENYGRDRITSIRATAKAEFGKRVLRFRLEGSSPDLLPSVTETLRIGEIFRRAVLSIQGSRSETLSTPLFSGKFADGTPLTGENHAYFLPSDRDGDGLLDTVDVYLPRAFSHDEYRALVSVSRLYSRDLKLAADDYIRATFLGDAQADPPSRRWRSTTPFVLPRYEKRRGTADARRIIDSPGEQIRRELGFRSLEAFDVEVARGADARIGLRGGRTVFAGSYRRRRDGDAGSREAVTATITFSEPVSGPIAIGMYAHFGLGQFVPLDTDD